MFHVFTSIEIFILHHRLIAAKCRARAHNLFFVINCRAAISLSIKTNLIYTFRTVFRSPNRNAFFKHSLTGFNYQQLTLNYWLSCIITAALKLLFSVQYFSSFVLRPPEKLTFNKLFFKLSLVFPFCLLSIKKYFKRREKKIFKKIVFVSLMLSDQLSTVFKSII